MTNNYTNAGKYDASGNDLGAIPNTSVDNCMISCDINSKCVGFAYYNPTRVCYPKTNVSNRQPNENMYTYVKKYNYTNEGNYDASGNDLGAIENTTVDYCKITCDGNPECLGFAFYNPTGDCYPKSNVSTRQPNPNMNLYVN